MLALFDYTKTKKSQYGIVETGNYWFAIFLDYHKKNLSMEISFYNAYLFITKEKGVNFIITWLLTNNVLNIRIETFMNKKEAEIKETNFKAKSQTMLEVSISKNFNSYYMTIKDEAIRVV